MSGYQPVPQHPPPSYPQGSASLPRGCAPPSKNASLPRMGASASKSGSLARGVSPIPRAYPALAEAPPGYPESPQKTGPPPLGYPLSPPEYPQTPTPPGICRDFQKISFWFSLNIRISWIKLLSQNHQATLSTNSRKIITNSLLTLKRRVLVWYYRLYKWSQFYTWISQTKLQPLRCLFIIYQYYLSITISPC